MILYSLKCAQDHSFDSWFANAAAFGSLAASGQVCCPVCGSNAVEKMLMAPSVRPARRAGKPQIAAPAAQKGALSAPQNPAETALAEMRRQVEAHSDYVGVNFVAEARKMHSGEKPERSIYGEARFDEAKALLEEGIAIAPLPFMPARKTN